MSGASISRSDDWVSRFGGSCAGVYSVQCGLIALRLVCLVEVFGGFDEARAWRLESIDLISL